MPKYRHFKATIKPRPAPRKKAYPRPDELPFMTVPDKSLRP